MSEVEVAQDLSLNIDINGEHDKFAHYVEQDQFMEALVHGLPAVALCGKIWVPTRDGNNYPVCKTCEEVYSQLI
jgi:hypothetical protein